MSDPVTTNILLDVPTRGSDPGTWDVPVNFNSLALDGILGGVQSVSCAASPITLTAPPGIPTPSAGPTQAQNAVLKLTGTVTAPVTVTLPLPGYYILDTVALAVSSTNLVTLRAVAVGEVICLPQGSVKHIYNDGTNVRFVNLGEIGTYLDYAGSATPGWITGCTVPPYLNCDGSTFVAATYPNLTLLLGGNVLPDFRGVSPAFLNQGTSRITTAGSGIDGNTRFSFGSSQTGTILLANLPAATLATSITDPGHTHAGSKGRTQGTAAPSGTSTEALQGSNNTASIDTQTLTISTAVTGITASTALGGSGTAFNRMGPTTISGIRLIRAG